MNKDQRGDLVEKLIFEAYKDKYIKSSEAFKQLIKKEYGYEVKTELYIKICNYQIKKYGCSLNNSVGREYSKYFTQKESTKRYWKRQADMHRERDRRSIERIEKNKYKEAA